MKARICPHGNKDRMKSAVRKYSAMAQFDAIRILLSITTLMPIRLSIIDISDTYMQSVPINRIIFVRPPREWRKKRKDKYCNY